jgi:hypothetical protein
MFKLNHNALNKEITITCFGKSMYGGWYANYRYEDKNGKWEFDGFHANTLRELCAQAELSRTAMERDVPRFDN